VKEEIGIMRRLANPNVIKFIDAFENSREIILGKSLQIILL
jgi:serine/threonine protein kinase